MNYQLFRLLRRSRVDGVPRSGTTPDSPATTADHRLIRVDDPDGRCTIVAVSGRVDAEAIETMWDEAERLGDSAVIHLDLTDAELAPGSSLHGLEILTDALESSGVDVRVVGLDPDHPDLR